METTIQGMQRFNNSLRKKPLRADDGVLKWGFPKIRVTFLGAPIVRAMVYWDLYWGPPIQGNDQMAFAAYPTHVQARNLRCEANFQDCKVR